MRKVISLLMSLLMCFSLSLTASAHTVSVSIVQPYYEKAYDATSKLTISGTTATCKSYVRGNSEVIKITAEQYLQKQGFLWIWSTYDNAEWTKTVYTNSYDVQHKKRFVKRKILPKNGFHAYGQKRQNRDYHGLQ